MQLPTNEVPLRKQILQRIAAYKPELIGDFKLHKLFPYPKGPSPTKFTDAELDRVIATLNELLGVSNDVRIMLLVRRDSPRSEGIYFRYTVGTGGKLVEVLDLYFDMFFNFICVVEDTPFLIPNLAIFFIPHISELIGRYRQNIKKGLTDNARFSTPDESPVMRNGLSRLRG